MNNLIDLIGLAANIYTLILLARVVISWVQLDPSNPVVGFLYRVTEPVLAPVRGWLPPMGGLDLSPLIVLVGIQILERLVISLLSRIA